MFRDSADAQKFSNPTKDCAVKDDIDLSVKQTETNKANINYHVRKFLETSNVKHSGSILNIRNLMEGEDLYKNQLNLF